MRSMMLTVNRDTLEELLQHAAVAARIVGHLDGGRLDAAVGPLGDHIDAIAHELGELLGDPRFVNAHERSTDAADQVVLNGAPMLVSATGGRR